VIVLLQAAGQHNWQKFIVKQSTICQHYTNYIVLRLRTKFDERTFSHTWNCLPRDVRGSTSWTF